MLAIIGGKMRNRIKLILALAMLTVFGAHAHGERRSDRDGASIAHA